VIEDLARFEVPAVLFSGGEPTCRADLPELVSYASSLGLRPVLSTNGTLLTSRMAGELWDAGLRRAGISLDGMEATNDRFRGQKGAFGAALSGIRIALEKGMRVSLRVTVTGRNAADLPALFELCEREGVQRICVYHLAYAGRGARLQAFDLQHADRRAAVEGVFRRTIESHASGRGLEVLTVDNHADGPFLALWSREHAPQRTGDIERLLRRNGGNSAGKGIGCIDNTGNVHPDQFWWSQTLGNVRERPFSEIWTDPSIELLRRLRDRKFLLPERCRGCRWLDMCNGNLRVRAETATGDTWGFDPACYLTDAEIDGVRA
jgi:radical SAM protein with 4Fe4S-binding SPASM domain